MIPAFLLSKRSWWHSRWCAPRFSLGIPDAAIARKIMELAEAGEDNPDRLCERVLMYFKQ
jgi:hypothetical protein